MHKLFNSEASVTRTTAQLKALWKRMKMQAKKDVSAHKKAQRQTGGGGKPESPTASTQTIVDLIPSEFEELHNPYDDDADNM